MSAINPRMRSCFYWPYAIGLAALLALSGCKSDNSNSGTRSSDPLVQGTRIPPQNVPLPDRGGIGSNGKTDPLMSPTSKPQDKSGVGWSDDPSRFKDTFIPSAASTPAALAGHLKESGELKIDGNENKVPLQQTGGVSSVRPFAQSAELASTYTQLEKYGCKAENRSLSQENGQYVIRATVPKDGPNGVGPKLQVMAVGQTPEEAASRLVDQVQMELGTPRQ
jgi:hypothetical protein